jgi:hypothetical protein
LKAQTTPNTREIKCSTRCGSNSKIVNIEVQKDLTKGEVIRQLESLVSAWKKQNGGENRDEAN